MTKLVYIFYGMELSFYAGKVRSYLRKKNLPFIERGVDHPAFADAVAKVWFEVQPLSFRFDETPRATLLSLG